MSGMLGGEYRDETRIVHMLQALERIEQETGETSRDKLFFNDRLTLKFSASPRLRERYRLGAGSSRYGNCFF